MKLSRLLSVLNLPCPADAEITSLACDSREVTPGALFAALPGAREDGSAHIGEAIQRGAAAVLCRPPLPEGVPAAAVDDPRTALAALAAQFYGWPAREMTMLAVTGTKGKTTTAYMLRSILMAAGHRCGMIGTLGSFLGDEPVAPAANTTPEPIALHRTLRQMAGGRCTHAVLEVSSQAMKLRRADGIDFAAGLFLNLSPDHIGGAEHADFDEYRSCKAALFRQCRVAVGNLADPNWPAMRAQLRPGAPALTFGMCPGADVRGSSVVPEGLASRLTVAGSPEPYAVPMPGAFNALNALAAIALCRTIGIDDKAVRRGLETVSVPGRAQLFPAPPPYTVLIDYAHNGESFRALLSALRPHTAGRIIAVFGAGGDRPPIRRADMARAAARYADLAVLTEDNPRSEDPAAICAQIADAMGNAIPHVTVLDRREAIFTALDLARPGDVVALLGKGHETYIESCGVRRHFSEWEVLEEYFGRN